MNYWMLFLSILVSILVLGSAGVLLVAMGMWDTLKDFLGWVAGVVGWAVMLTADVWCIAHV